MIIYRYSHQEFESAILFEIVFMELLNVEQHTHLLTLFLFLFFLFSNHQIIKNIFVVKVLLLNIISALNYWFYSIGRFTYWFPLGCSSSYSYSSPFPLSSVTLFTVVVVDDPGASDDGFDVLSVGLLSIQLGGEFSLLITWVLWIMIRRWFYHYFKFLFQLKENLNHFRYLHFVLNEVRRRILGHSCRKKWNNNCFIH